MRKWYLKNLLKVGVLNTFSITNRKIAQRYGLKTNDWLVGIAYTGRMNAQSLIKGIQRQPGSSQLTEVLVHPTLLVGDKEESYCDAKARDYVFSPYRRIETEMLIAPEVIQAVDKIAPNFLTFPRSGQKGAGKHFTVSGATDSLACKELRSLIHEIESLSPQVENRLTLQLDASGLDDWDEKAESIYVTATREHDTIILSTTSAKETEAGESIQRIIPVYSSDHVDTIARLIARAAYDAGLDSSDV